MVLPTTRTADEHAEANWGVVATSVLTTVSSVYPAFLAGALGDELRDEINVGDRLFGLIVGAFFFGAMVGSAAMGRIGERVGARRMIVLAAATTATTCLVIAAFVRSGEGLVVALVIAGVANSAGQTAANKLLGQSVAPGRLGLAMAIKQSGMPGASMLGGLAVPIIALTIGWQWGYVAAAVLAAAAMTAALRFAPSEQVLHGQGIRSGSLGSSRQTLRIAALAAALAAAGAGTIGNWITSSATDAGMSRGAAGLLLAAGAVAGIAVRLCMGAAIDRRPSLPPLRIASRFLAFGSIGVAVLGVRAEWAQIVAAFIAFGAGWAWPALYNYGIVRTNKAAASTATGITQTGVYIGVFSGPVIMGLLVDRWGYGAGWGTIAVSMAFGSVVMAFISPKFVDETAPA